MAILTTFKEKAMNSLTTAADKGANLVAKASGLSSAQLRDIEELLEKLKAEGVIRIPFNMGYDMRQRGSKAYKGCYMEIKKVA